MRTKNAKRLWPVPATLAVMALAALLAFGLLATTGAQPAEAQDDADCEVTVAATADGTPTVVDQTDTDTDTDCTATGDSATIKFTGPPTTRQTGETESLKVLLLFRDANGSVAAYENGYVVYDIEDDRYELTAMV